MTYTEKEKKKKKKEQKAAGAKGVVEPRGWVYEEAEDYEEAEEQNRSAQGESFDVF